MSLEDLLAENNELLVKQNALLAANNEMLTIVINRGRENLASSTASAKAVALGKDAVEEKPKATRGRTAKAKPPTVKEIQQKTTDYLDVDDDAEYEERAELITRIVKHFGVEKMSEIGDDDRTLAMQMLDAAVAGDDPFQDIEPKEETKPARRALV